MLKATNKRQRFRDKNFSSPAWEILKANKTKLNKNITQRVLMIGFKAERVHVWKCVGNVWR